MGLETATGGPAREFPRTRWTLVLSSREDPGARRAALEELLGACWKPLYHCARRRGLAVEAAKDAVQGLFAQLLERDFLSKLEPGKGTMRSYLKAALQHYLINEHESAAAAKRGGGAAPRPLEFDLAERDLAGAPPAPDDAFEREWATGVMERSIEALRREFEEGERRGPFDLVLRFFRFGEAPSYEEAAAQSGMSLSQLKAFLHRARVRFRQIVRREVAQTVADPAEVDVELEHLLRVLSR